MSGVILADQVKSLDWRTRRTELICVLSESTVAEVLKKLGVYIGGWTVEGIIFMFLFR